MAGGGAAQHIFCGAAAGAITKTSVAPLERIKIIMQVHGMQAGTESTKLGIVSTGLRVVREEGALALWRSNGVNCLRIVPVYALKFGMNESFRELYKLPGQDVKQGLHMWQLVAAGGSAGAVQGSLTYPLDLIKTRLALAKSTGLHYDGMVDCVRQTVRQEGVRGLYSGFLLSLWVVIPYVAIQMSTFDVMQRKLRGWVSETNDVTGEGLSWAAVGGTKALAGACAGIATQTITYPGNTMIKRMQSNGAGGKPKIYASTFDCIRTILAKEGVGGFYRGLGLNVIKGIPNATIQFVAYDTIKALVIGR
eukprot:COSAG01_NODE_3918_length_5538_cov_28.353374_1_plen_307_part_00